MKSKNKIRCLIAAGLIAAFAIWTLLIRTVDVRAIGPEGSEVGFAALNGAFHGLTGVHMWLYTLTDWLGLVPIAVAMGFGVQGLVQSIARRSLFKVEYRLFVLGGFYLAVMAVFLLFEVFVVNYRPVLIEGILEASYPSSTTLLVMCIMPTALIELCHRIKGRALKCGVAALITAFTVFMVVGRLLSGVHWVTDIVGGGLISAGLVMSYLAVCGFKAE